MRLWSVMLARRFCRVAWGRIRTRKKRGRRNRSQRPVRPNREVVGCGMMKGLAAFQGCARFHGNDAPAPNWLPGSLTMPCGRGRKRWGVRQGFAPTRLHLERTMEGTWVARQSTWYLVPRSRGPARGRFHDLFCSSLCEPWPVPGYRPSPPHVACSTRHKIFICQTPRPGDRDYPSSSPFDLITS